MRRIWAGIDAGKTHHHCVVIDADGKIAGRYEGAMHLRAMEEAVLPLLVAGE